MCGCFDHGQDETFDPVAIIVHVACLECREDMPAEDSEIRQAEEEGIEIHCSLTPSRVLENNGKVAGVECQEIEGLQFDENGRPSFRVVEDAGHVLDVDTVIFAIGQVPELTGLSGDIKSSPTGTIATDAETFMTARRGIFSAGDVINGPTSAVDAIASGQKAAFFINRYLQGDVLRVRPEKTINPKDITVDIPADKEKQPRQVMPTLPVNERLSNFKEVALFHSGVTSHAISPFCIASVSAASSVSITRLPPLLETDFTLRSSFPSTNITSPISGSSLNLLPSNV